MDIDNEFKYDDLEQLDLSLSTQSLKLDIEWFRAVMHSIIPNPNWHAHSSLEIHFVLDGHLVFHFSQSQKAINVDKGNLILIPANCSHCIKNDTGGKYIRYVLNVSLESIDNNPETAFLCKTLMVNEPVCIPVDRNICSLLHSCSVEATERISGFISMIQYNIQVILMLLARELAHTRKASYRIEEKQNHNIQRSHYIVRYIERNIGASLTVTDIARYMHLSTKQIQRIIKKQYGITVKQLMMQVQLKKAKDLLKDPYKSIGSVSRIMNFPSEQYFSRFFKKTEGMTPSQYRNSILPGKLPKNAGM